MGITTLDLFRAGDHYSSGLENVRPGIDVVTYQHAGILFVKGTPQGGVSTRSVQHVLKRSTSRWWCLSAGYDYPDTLTLRNDRGNHWLWEASVDMPFDDYRLLLEAVSQNYL